MSKVSDWVYIAIFILSGFICSCTQIMLKKNADKDYRGIRIYLNFPVIASNFIFLGATLLSVYLMRYIMLSTASILNTLTYVFIPFLSTVFLKEKITKRMIIGISFIICGVAIYSIWGI